LVTCSSLKKDTYNEAEAKEATTGYSENYIHGFTVKTSSVDEQTPLTRMALERMESDLERITQLFTEAQLREMQRNSIWLTNSEPVEAARFHPNKQWLIDNGFNSEMAQSVEVSNMTNYLSWTSKNQPYMVLHELAHLYHHEVLSDGFQNARVLTAFNAAVASKKYEAVRYFNGTDTVNNVRAYAIANQMEYFAELSEAYFGNNDFQPFNYEELKTFDPAGFALMEEIWGKRE
jgi:hypothetical protein